jgi:hypothetical protein
VPLLLLVLLLPIVVLAFMPVILVQRYRIGTSRRLARPWAASLTLGAMVFSVGFFLAGAGLTTLWAPGSLARAALGVLAGLALGAVGLWLTRWEPSARALHYTPNRWLVLVVTLLVSARVVYGLWRSWSAVGAGLGGSSAVEAFGVPDSMAAAGVVLGYYLAFSAGVRWRIRRWQARRLRVL